jgi:D-alanyl-D-alanine carboxypeptidase/D-alanyl-D-alanine-endopeptidase (penicillin-binding protein 4)
VVRLLTYASQQPWGALYEDTLPVAGLDGSLRERFKLGLAQQRVHAKTGSLGHVNALSGYATSVKGEKLVFTVMANNHNLTNKRAVETIDRIVDAIVTGK